MCFHPAIVAPRNSGAAGALCRRSWRVGLALAVAVLMPIVRGAADMPTWWLDLQTYSFHEHTSQTYLHNTTPGLGVLRRQSNWLAGAGVFRNSLGRWAGYGYGGYQWPLGPVRAGAIAGVTHNYDANNRGPVPLAAAVVTIPLHPRWAIDLIAIPRVANYTYATLNVSISWRFK
jgi:hypothetical protein